MDTSDREFKRELLISFLAHWYALLRQRRRQRRARAKGRTAA